MGSLNIVVSSMTLGSVKGFRGHAVTDFVIKVTEDEFVSHLNDNYAAAVVCNVTYPAGEALKVLSPWLFNTSRREYQEELQAMLLSQVKQGNDVDIDFND